MHVIIAWLWQSVLSELSTCSSFSSVTFLITYISHLMWQPTLTRNHIQSFVHLVHIHSRCCVAKHIFTKQLNLSIHVSQNTFQLSSFHVLLGYHFDKIVHWQWIAILQLIQCFTINLVFDSSLNMILYLRLQLWHSFSDQIVDSILIDIIGIIDLWFINTTRSCWVLSWF